MSIPSYLSVAFVYRHKISNEVLVVDIDGARELDAAMAFFRDGSDGHVASQMLQILEEERGTK